MLRARGFMVAPVVANLWPCGRTSVGGGGEDIAKSKELSAIVPLKRLIQASCVVLLG
jgi:hypothetical protein